MLLVVLVSGVGLSLVCMFRAVFFYSNGLDESPLWRNEAVVVVDGDDDVDVVEGWKTHLQIVPGTRGVAVMDYAGDRDDCHRSRPIVVKITDGPHHGAVAKIPRYRLRVSGWW
jgi:hypothetical protein